LTIPLALLKRIDITQTEKILLALFGDEVCTLTVKEIADKIGLVPFAVSKAIKNLEKDSEIEVIKTKTRTNTLRYNYKVKGV
jgi:DNA-binding MarR family transcriptional regulator